MQTRSGKATQARASRLDEGFSENLHDKLLPLFAIGLGVSMGIGLAYMAKKHLLKDLNKGPSITYVEERRPRPSSSELAREKMAVLTTTETSPILGAPPASASPGVRPLQITEDNSRSDADKTARAPLALLRAPARDTIRSLRPVTPPLSPKLTSASPKRTAGEESGDLGSMRLSALPSPREAKSPAEIRGVSFKNMSFQKQNFSQCAEECLMNFRSPKGDVVQAKLKKSVFAKLLNSYHGTLDIEGIETKYNGQRIVTVRSLKPLVNEELAEDSNKGARRSRGEKAILPESVVDMRSGDELPVSEPVNLRAKLETAPSKRKAEPENTVEEGEEEETSGPQSFQARLKRSVE